MTPLPSLRVGAAPAQGDKNLLDRVAEGGDALLDQVEQGLAAGGPVALGILGNQLLG